MYKVYLVFGAEELTLQQLGGAGPLGRVLAGEQLDVLAEDGPLLGQAVGDVTLSELPKSVRPLHRSAERLEQLHRNHSHTEHVRLNTTQGEHFTC